MGDVEIVLEVMTQREVQERAARGGQLHGRRQATLHDGEVAGGQVSVKVCHISPHFEAVGLGQGRQVDPRTCDDDHAQFRYELLGRRERRNDLAKQISPDSGAADSDQANLLVMQKLRSMTEDLLRVGQQ